MARSSSEKKQSRRQRISTPQLILLAAIGMVLFFVANYVGRDLENRRVQADLLQWQGKLAEEQARGARLQQELAHVQSPEYLEQQARQELNLVRPGDIQIAPVAGPTAVPPVTATPPAPSPAPSHWPAWRARFFGPW